MKNPIRSHRFRQTLLCVALGAASSLSAITFSIPGDTSDRDIYADGSSTWVGQPSLRVGYLSQYRSVFYMFALPSIPDGEVVTDASLTFEVSLVQSFGADLSNADLFALDYRSTPSITIADHYQGPFSGDPTNTGIQDDILVRTMSEGTVTTDNTGSANIVAYVNEQINTGALAGDFLVFRLNMDDTIAMSETRYFTVETANSQTPAYVPVLSLTTDSISAIPEPSLVALFSGLIGLAFITGRRQYRKNR